MFPFPRATLAKPGEKFTQENQEIWMVAQRKGFVPLIGNGADLPQTLLAFADLNPPAQQVENCSWIFYRTATKELRNPVVINVGKIGELSEHGRLLF